MFYYLFDYLDKQFDLAGAGVFQYISFRAWMAIVASLVISMVFGRRFIRILQKLQIGESIRDLGLQGQNEKAGTPTMGGVIIIACILVPTLLFARLENIYVILLLVSTVWMGTIGFLDDYIKVFKKNKKGLAGKFKVVGQVGLGLIVGLTLSFSDNVIVRQYETTDGLTTQYLSQATEATFVDVTLGLSSPGQEVVYQDVKSTVTTIPFVKDNEWDYSRLMPAGLEDYTWVLYCLLSIIVVTAVSNGANMTDGLDGLASGTSAIIGTGLAVLAYVSGHTGFADYLNIMFIPNSGEIVVFCAAFVGATLGFLWHNSFPARVFMGDTGSLCLGGIIAVIALAIRKELLIPVLCGIFLVENLSVILQVGYFKYTKKKYGEGRRIFRMAPLHHHYQKGGLHEAKIVARFWIVGILLAVLTLATLKLR